MLTVLVASLTACGAGIVLKQPIAGACEDAHLKDCPDVADGALAYIEGDKAGAVEKLKVAARSNSPQEFRSFAKAVKDLASIGAISNYAPKLKELSALLDEVVGPEPKEPPAAELAPYEPHHKVVSDAFTPDAVFVTSTALPALDPKGGACAPFADLGSDVALSGATCLRVATGPAVVTDLHVPSSTCGSRMFALVGPTSAPRWFIVLAPNAPLDVHGARLVVQDGEPLVFGVHGGGTKAPRDIGCAVTWTSMGQKSGT